MKLDTKKSLIIDEDEKVCQILQMRLSALGYIVSLMKNENDAITIFEKEKPDLVILDIFLSNVDGLDEHHQNYRCTNTGFLF